VDKKKVKIYKILGICPGKFHAWVDSNIGIIRKPLENIRIVKKDMFQISFKPIDIIAIITIIGGLILKFSGIDGTIGTLLTAVVLFYFGKKEIYDKSKEKTVSWPKAKTIEEIIRIIAKEESVDPDLAVRVAKCESGLNPAATNTNLNGTIDRGLYQWNTKWHPEISDEVAFDAEKATRAFCKAFKEGHLDWWNATKECWEI